MSVTDLRTIITKLQEDFQQTIAAQTAEAQGRLLAIIDDLHAVAQEQIQAICRDEIKKMIHALRNGLKVTAADIDQIKLWIIGDEKGHEQSEHHCRVWGNELRDVLMEIHALQDASGTLADYMRFQALLRRASVVLSDIFYCRQQKERLVQIQQIGPDLTPAQRSWLIRVLEDKLEAKDG